MSSTNLTALSTVGTDRMATESLIYGLNSAFIIISTICLALRLYTRTFIIRALGADDAMAVVAFAFVVFQSSMDMYFVPLGSGVHIDAVDSNDLARFLDLIPIMLMVLFWTLLAVRLTCILFLPRLSQETTYLRLVYAVATVAAINTIVCFFLVLTECTPIRDLWNSTKADRNCHPKSYEAHTAWANSSIGLLTDICIMALPIWMIMKNLRFSRAKAFQVCMIFCVGFFSIVCAAIRLGLIITIDLAVDVTFKFPKVAAWTEAEVHLGFWVACAPAVKPLLRLASFKLGLRTSPDSTDRRRGETKYRVPSRASSPKGFHESLATMPSSGGKVNTGTREREEIELVGLEHGDERRGRM